MGRLAATGLLLVFLGNRHPLQPLGVMLYASPIVHLEDTFLRVHAWVHSRLVHPK
jgi:hypothetical protein